MALYAIGDIHGSMDAFTRLLEKIEFQAREDQLWLVGDLINGGPNSLAVLRWAHAHREDIVVVQGNHELHMLAVADGIKEARPSDTFQDIFDAPDRDELLEWVRHWPMLHHVGRYVLVHSGLLPQWTVDEARALAHEIEVRLRGSENKRKSFFAAMYGNDPAVWHPDLRGPERLRIGVNAMTRMRVLDEETCGLEFKFKGELGDVPEGHVPWFDAPGRQNTEVTVICGHWSALGLQIRDDLIALDTGCVWGRELTAVCLNDMKIHQVPCY
ncbi:MAG: symmetrical bis(5'-nucleosyl)-tetraphosphatase [Bradymonadaceae bacterium]